MLWCGARQQRATKTTTIAFNMDYILSSSIYSQSQGFLFIRLRWTVSYEIYSVRYFVIISGCNKNNISFSRTLSVYCLLSFHLRFPISHILLASRPYRWIMGRYELSFPHDASGREFCNEKEMGKIIIYFDEEFYSKSIELISMLYMWFNWAVMLALTLVWMHGSRSDWNAT